MKASSARRKGTTLIELLIVIFILGLVMTVAFRLVREGMTVWREGEVRLEAQRRGRRALEKISRELRSIYPPPPDLKFTFAEGNEELSYIFEGSSQRIKFVTAISFPPTRISGKPHLAKIEYFLDWPGEDAGGGLRRRVKTFLGVLISDSLEEGIVGWDIRYWEPITGWVDEWKLEKEPIKGSLPLAVKITIQMKEGREREQIRAFSTMVHLPVSRYVRNIAD